MKGCRRDSKAPLSFPADTEASADTKRTVYPARRTLLIRSDHPSGVQEKHLHEYAARRIKM